MKTEQMREIGQHTTLPWHRHGISVQGSEDQGLVRLAAQAPTDDFAAWTTPENADLIVRAVNSHEELLEACEAAMRILEDYPFEDYTAMTADRIPTVVIQLRAAVAKARGVQP